MNSILPALLLAVPALTQAPTATPWASLDGQAACYDIARDRFLFTSRTSRDLWETDGLRWSQRRDVLPAAGPRSCAYDSVHDRTFLASLDELVEYDGHRAVVRAPMPGPNARIAFDSVRGQLLAIAGTAGVPTVHRWNGSAWVSLPAIDASPRVVSQLAFDAQRGVLVVSTFRLGSGLGAETCEWDGAAWRVVPAAYPGNVLAYDPIGRRVISVGAANTQAWDGSTWRVVDSSWPVTNVAVATDPVHGRVLAATPRELREWTGTTWVPALPTPYPAAATSLVYDSVRDRTVAVVPEGGATSVREWNGSRWSAPVGGAGAPSGRPDHALVFDAARGETLLFGGRNGPNGLGDTWLWNGTSWRLGASTGPAAGPAGVAFDSTRGVVVLVDQAGTEWHWHGATWTPAGATPLRGDCALGYDPARDRVVGIDAQGTYERGPTGWALVPGPNPLFVAAGSSLVRNAAGRLETSIEFWQLPAGRYEWDGAAWTLVGTGTARGGLAYDARRDVMLTLPFAIESRTAAAAADLGTPCGGTGTATSVAPFDQPRPGNVQFGLDVRAEASNRPALLGIGLASTGTPVGNGCTLYVAQPIATLVWATGSFGTWHQPLPLADALWLRGVQLTTQAAVLDPSSPGGFAMSQALLLTIGD